MSRMKSCGAAGGAMSFSSAIDEAIRLHHRTADSVRRPPLLVTGLADQRGERDERTPALARQAVRHAPRDRGEAAGGHRSVAAVEMQQALAGDDVERRILSGM